jgi:N-acetylmuramoyl-L-alanine amidase
VAWRLCDHDGLRPFPAALAVLVASLGLWLHAQTPAPTTTTAPDARPGAAADQGDPMARARLTAPIVIDPGHGGDEAGARSASGLEEKALALDVARRLKTVLESKLGLGALLTREGDTAMTLDERAAFANTHTGSLFISLHANTAPSPTVEGAEIYYLLADDGGEETDARAARRGGVVSPPSTGRPLALIPWEGAQVPHLGASAILAETLAQALAGQLPVSGTPLRRAPLRLLESVSMPAVLVELVFLSSPAQEKLARTDAFKASAAEALADGIARFRRGTPSEPRP